MGLATTVGGVDEQMLLLLDTTEWRMDEKMSMPI